LAVAAVGQGAELAGRGGGAGDEEALASVVWRPSAASRRLACSAGRGVDGGAARADGRKRELEVGGNEEKQQWGWGSGGRGARWGRGYSILRDEFIPGEL
jgi:hypothetical protein